MQALSNDTAFVRVRKGVYALRALAGGVRPMPPHTLALTEFVGMLHSELYYVQALSNDAAFVRVRKGVYALRALAGNVGPMPHNTPKSSRPPRYEYRDSYREGSAGSDLGSRASFRDDDIARAEYEVDAARQAVGDLMRQIEQVCLCGVCLRGVCLCGVCLCAH